MYQALKRRKETLVVLSAVTVEQMQCAMCNLFIIGKIVASQVNLIIVLNLCTQSYQFKSRVQKDVLIIGRTRESL